MDARRSTDNRPFAALTSHSSFKNIWHAMTSYDRHSNYNSPYRTGQHVPLNPETGRMSALASVATASESRHDISSPYTDYAANGMATVDGGVGSPRASIHQQPYSPGARSESARRQSRMGDGFEMQSPTGEIPMQSFEDGLPPAPPISNSWKRIDKWADENYPELFDQLCEGCTSNDLNELEHILDCSLPMDVRESLQIHDGQERGGIPTGIIFGSMLLDCEEIVQEWENWRKVNTEFLQESAAAAAAAAATQPTMPAKVSNGSAAGPTSSASASGSVHGSDEASSSRSAPPASGNSNPMWRQELLARQDCIPAGAVQKAYAHPAWIPLVRDWGGNNLAIDLAPGPRGQWGQVILFGRDYDTKYVVARSWTAFLALVADDLNSGKWYIDEDSKELKLREFKTTRVEPAYFDILRWRMDQKYGRRVAKRKSVVPGTNGSPTGTGSPYASPTEPNAPDRGRPLQRLSVNSPLTSPNRPGYGSKLSPLARVTEETSLPELDLTLPDDKAAEKLVEVETPRLGNDELRAAPANASTSASAPNGSSSPIIVNDENANPANAGKKSATVTTVASGSEDGMKTIEI